MIVQFLINFVLTTFLLVYYLYKVNFHNLFDKNPSGFGSKKKTKTAAGLIFSIILLINLIYFFLIILFLIFYQTDFIYLFYQFFY